jgi:RNA 3'-terminal phosphate cyclase
MIHPAKKLSPLRLTNRGRLERIRGVSAAANLDISVAERQRIQALKRLDKLATMAEIELLDMAAPSKGTFLLLLAELRAHNRASGPRCTGKIRGARSGRSR